MTSDSRRRCYTPLTMTFQRFILLPVGFLLVSLAGCGDNSPAPSVDGSGLTGNWTLTGSRQLNQLPYLSAALAVNGTQISAHGDRMISCGPGFLTSSGSSFELTGQIAADGTFTLSESAPGGLIDTIQLTIKGSVPAPGANSWSGSFTVTSLPGSIGCTVNQAGTFTATALNPVAGTYMGTFPSLTSTGSISVTANLTQGGILQIARGTLAPESYLSVTGLITVTGSPCFTHGTASVSTTNPLPGQIDGDYLNMNFDMDDGSRVTLSGRFAGPDEASLNIFPFVVFGGQCNDAAYNGTLTRQ